MPSPFVSNNEVPKNDNEEVLRNDIDVVITSTTEFPEEISEEEWKNAQLKDFGIEDGTYYFFPLSHTYNINFV